MTRTITNQITESVRILRSFLVFRTVMSTPMPDLKINELLAKFASSLPIWSSFTPDSTASLMKLPVGEFKSFLPTWNNKPKATLVAETLRMGLALNATIAPLSTAEPTLYGLLCAMYDEQFGFTVSKAFRMSFVPPSHVERDTHLYYSKNYLHSVVTLFRSLAAEDLSAAQQSLTIRTR